MKEMARHISKTPSLSSQQQHHSSQYDDTNDTIMQEIEEQAARKKMEEEALQARLKKMDALERQNEKKKKREEKKIQKKQQRCETQKKAFERKMEELDDTTDNGTNIFPQQKNEVSNFKTDKESNANMNVIQACRPTVINKESKSDILLQHFAPNYVLTGIKTESQSSILEKQFNIGWKSSMMLLDSSDKEDPTSASCLQHHLKELMQVQPAQHTEQQLKVEREWLHLEQIQKDQEELERLREKQDENMKTLGCRSLGGSVLLSEFNDEKQLEKLQQEHLQHMRHLELLRNEEEAYEIQQSRKIEEVYKQANQEKFIWKTDVTDKFSSFHDCWIQEVVDHLPKVMRLQQLRQQKIKQEAPKWYDTPGKEAALPVVNGKMIRQEKKQEKLEEILPNPQEEMLKQALEPSKLTAMEDKERLNKHVAKKGESNTTRKAIPTRSTLVSPIKLQDLGGLQSIWDIEVSKPSPSFAGTSMSHNPASQFSRTYAESIKPKSTCPSWTLPSSPPNTSSLSLLPSPMDAELIKLKPISPVSCPSLTSHSEQGIISRQQSIDQYQSEIHPITTVEKQRGHVALNCNNSAVEHPSKVERQKVIGQSFCKADVIVIPAVQNLQHNMEVDIKSAKMDDDWKVIEEDWDAEVDEVIAKRKPFIEDMGKGKKRLWSCYSIKQEKIVFPCRKDFASSIREFKVRKEKQKLELCGVGPNNAEHKSEPCQKEDLVKGSFMFGFSCRGSASASRRGKAVGKGGFKQRQSNRNTSELNNIQSRMHENKECGTVTWSFTKSKFKRFPEESSLPARETNKLDRNKLNKNNLSSYCDTTNPSPHAISTFSSQEPGTIPPSIQQNNLPTKQSPLRQSGKPVPFFPQTESWDDEIDSVPYIQADVAPKEVISNGEYLNQDMLANQFSSNLSMEDALSKTVNNKTTAKKLDAQELHDWFNKQECQFRKQEA